MQSETPFHRKLNDDDAQHLPQQASGRVEKNFADAEAQSVALASEIAKRLTMAVGERGSALLAVSGAFRTDNYGTCIKIWIQCGKS